MFKLIIRKEGFETKLQALESPDSDKRPKSYTKTKIESEIAIRKIADLIREKEKRRTFARTNERTNARYLNKPEKPIYFKKPNLKKTDGFLKKNGAENKATANLDKRAGGAARHGASGIGAGLEGGRGAGG